MFMHMLDCSGIHVELYAVTLEIKICLIAAFVD